MQPSPEFTNWLGKSLDIHRSLSNYQHVLEKFAADWVVVVGKTKELEIGCRSLNRSVFEVYHEVTERGRSLKTNNLDGAATNNRAFLKKNLSLLQIFGELSNFTDLVYGGFYETWGRVAIQHSLLCKTVRKVKKRDFANPLTSPQMSLCKQVIELIKKDITPLNEIASAFLNYRDHLRDLKSAGNLCRKMFHRVALIQRLLCKAMSARKIAAFHHPSEAICLQLFTENAQIPQDFLDIYTTARKTLDLINSTWKVNRSMDSKSYVLREHFANYQEDYYQCANFYQRCKLASEVITAGDKDRLEPPQFLLKMRRQMKMMLKLKREIVSYF